MQEKAEEAADAASAWFWTEQEPVEFSSIADGSYTLDGKYGAYKAVGINQIFISQTVTGLFADGNHVYTWASMEDPDNPGMVEAHTCGVIFREANAAADMIQDGITVDTFTGSDVMGAWTGPYADWCPDADADALRFL